VGKIFLQRKADFLKIAEKGRIAPLVFEEEIGEHTPTSLYARLVRGRPSFLLESAGGSPNLTQYSFLGLDPFLVFKSNGSDNPFIALREILTKLVPHPLPSPQTLPIPFWGGAVGFLSYDAGRHIERLPTWAKDDLKLPESFFIFPRVLICFAHHTGKLYLIINQLIGEDPNRSYREAMERMEEVLCRMSDVAVKSSGGLQASKSGVWSLESGVQNGWGSNLSQQEFEDIVRRAKEYIYAGDIFQANLSQRLEMPFTGDPFSLYLRLREINPSPFAAYLDVGDFQIVSSSPERLICLRDGWAETRPIAGTRHRGATTIEDRELSAELLLDQKERAEHIMLVDLERNDLGRVCQWGTVEVSELMVIEKYSHVIHIVSNVRGKLRQNKDQFDLIQAMFPGGTITGCPKVRCMEIIEELEPVRRGPYTGSLGYFGFNGNMDMNILIRTIILKEGIAHIQVGAGIVADSQPTREYYETLSKAEAMLKALEAQSPTKVDSEFFFKNW